jgi:ribonuclease P protein component
MTDQRFRGCERLRRPGDFQAVYSARRSVAGGPLVVYALPNVVGHARLGLSVGRTVGDAVTRNRVKRMLRESFRLQKCVLPAGFDFVVVAKSAGLPPLAELMPLIATLFRKAATRCADLPPPA